MAFKAIFGLRTEFFALKLVAHFGSTLWYKIIFTLNVPVFSRSASLPLSLSSVFCRSARLPLSLRSVFSEILISLFLRQFQCIFCLCHSAQYFVAQLGYLCRSAQYFHQVGCAIYISRATETKILISLFLRQFQCKFYLCYNNKG